MVKYHHCPNCNSPKRKNRGISIWQCQDCGTLMCNNCAKHSGFLNDTVRCPKCESKRKKVIGRFY